MQNSKQHEIEQKVADTQKQFYEQNSKNRVFKNNQKLQCAKQVASNVDLSQLINLTYFHIPNTNIVYFNYMLFKTYATEEIKDPLYAHFCNVVATVISMYGNFQMHCNLQSFTVSAAQRYYTMITSSIDSNDQFSKKMTHLYVYHTPSVIEQIIFLLKKSVGQFANRTTFYKKEESEAKIQQLFANM